MIVPKKKAIDLLNKKIKRFKEIQNAPYSKIYDDNYHYVYQGAIKLLGDFFPSGNEDWRVQHEVGSTREESYIDESQNTLRYQVHIKLCIAELRMAKDRLTYLPEIDETHHPSESGSTSLPLWMMQRGSILPRKYQKLSKDMTQERYSEMQKRGQKR